MFMPILFMLPNLSSTLTTHRRDDHLGHYDRRFFSKVVNDEERTDTQSHMIRAYLNFFREEGLDTWIAHGTLLGWWWNGKVISSARYLDTVLTLISAYLGTPTLTRKSRMQPYNTLAKHTTRRGTIIPHQTETLIASTSLTSIHGYGSEYVEMV
jgi:hypothetical protein